LQPNHPKSEQRLVSNVCGILLAAGSGSRFGGGKLAHPLPGAGVPIAVESWRRLRAAMANTCVVVRSGDPEVLALFRDEGARIIECDDAASGMGRSLSCGVRANAYASGWLIALGDMPWLRTETVRAIADALDASGRIVIPAIEGRRGHPVGFPARLYPALADLRGDNGARSVVQGHAADVTELAVKDPGIFADIDTREDLARMGGP
jgi:molybdenum cofactor cytidylyltransferase